MQNWKRRRVESHTNKMLERCFMATMKDASSGRMDSDNETSEISLSASGSYQDYAKAPVPTKNSGNTTGGETTFRAGISSNHFPALLHAMITRAEADGYNGICSWESHGRAFAIHDLDRFVAQVMPMYFRQTHFASFQRKLNVHGFERLLVSPSQDKKSGGGGAGTYYHAMFLRSRPDLCSAIQRKTEKDSREMKKQSMPNKDILHPDFSRFQAMPPSSPKQIQAAANIMSSSMGRNNIQQRGRSPPPPPPSAIVSSENETYASLFLDESKQEELDLSWMDPTPIAPELAALLQDSRNAISNESNGGVCSETHTCISRKNVREPEVQTEDSDDIRTVSENEESRSPKLRKKCIDISHPREDCSNGGSFSQGMCMGKEIANKNLPPHLLMNKKTKREENKQDGTRPVVSPKASKVKLPCTFPEVYDFPEDHSLMITSIEAPYTVIYANRALEALWEVKREEIVDRPLQEYSISSDHQKMNATTYSVVFMRKQQECEMNFQLLDRTKMFSAHVGPFYMADDPNQINDVQYLVWYFV